MKQGKQVQVPETVLADIIRLSCFLDGYELDERVRSVLDGLLAVVDGKLEAMGRREAFTAYKTAADGREREQRRREYLDAAGIHADWRTSKETRP